MGQKRNAQLEEQPLVVHPASLLTLAAGQADVQLVQVVLAAGGASPALNLAGRGQACGAAKPGDQQRAGGRER